MLRVAALALLLAIIHMHLETADAQSQGLQSVMTGAGELLVGLDISYPKGEDSTTFTIAFYHPLTTERTEEHIDYDFLILKEGKPIFRAAMQDDSPVGIIHSITGAEKHAFSFDDTGAYTARVVIYGLRMVFVEPVHADFPVAVTPEFQMAMPVMALAAGGIALISFGMKRFRAYYRALFAFFHLYIANTINPAAASGAPILSASWTVLSRVC